MRRMTAQTHRLSIGRFTGRCAATGAELVPGSRCVTVVVDRGDEGFERLDYSPEAWETQSRPPGVVCVWRSVAPEPEAKRGLVIDDEVLEEMVTRLAGDDRPDRVAFRWLVSLMLLRKRRLRHLRVERRDGREIWLFARRGEEEGNELEVVNPHLGEEDLRSLAEQLGAFVESDLD